MNARSIVRLLPLALALLGATAAEAQSTHPTTGSAPSRQPTPPPIDPSAANAKSQLRGGEISMIELQSLTSQRQTNLQMATGLARQLNDSSKKVAGNIGGGGGSSPRTPSACASCPARRLAR